MFNNSHANVDLSTAAYHHHDVDIKPPIENSHFTLLRHYSSQRVYVGLFGFGWCTPFETKLEIINKNQVRLVQCDSSYQMSFQRIDINSYVNSNFLDESVLRLKSGYYQRQSPLIGTQTFDPSGKLITWKDPEQIMMKFVYDKSERLTSIVTDQSGQYLFHYKKDTFLVDRLETRHKKTISYQYQGSQLTQVRYGRFSQKDYQYDELSNITQIKRNQRLVQSISYDSRLDRVRDITDGDGCHSLYSYSANLLAMYIRSQVKKTCPEKPSTSFKKEFWYIEKNSQLLLSQTKVSRGEQIFLTRYNLSTGEIIAVQALHHNLEVRIERNHLRNQLQYVLINLNDQSNSQALASGSIDQIKHQVSPQLAQLASHLVTFSLSSANL